MVSDSQFLMICEHFAYFMKHFIATYYYVFMMIISVFI